MPSINNFQINGINYDKRGEDFMSNYQIVLNETASKNLERLASERGIYPEQLASEILHLHLDFSHTMEKKEVCEGYEEMGELNLLLAD